MFILQAVQVHPSVHPSHLSQEPQVVQERCPQMGPLGVPAVPGRPGCPGGPWRDKTTYLSHTNGKSFRKHLLCTSLVNGQKLAGCPVVSTCNKDDEFNSV